ncbi:MAG: hypothetical protein ABL996_03275 [Micropepsaceae bacterium]
MIARAHLIDLLFVIAPQSLLLDIAGSAEAFRLANLHRQRRGLPPCFRLRFSGPEATVPTSVGLALTNLEPLPQKLSAPTWVVLVGQPSAHANIVTPEIAATAQWLNQTLRQPLLAEDPPTAWSRSVRAHCSRRAPVCSRRAAARRTMNC